MPYFTPYNNKPIEIDFNRYQPVSVISNFAKDGRCKPEYIRLVMPDESEVTHKITGFKYTREYKDHILYCCTIRINNRQQEILLYFYFTLCIWVIEK